MTEAVITLQEWGAAAVGSSVLQSKRKRKEQEGKHILKIAKVPKPQRRLVIIIIHTNIHMEKRKINLLA